MPEESKLPLPSEVLTHLRRNGGLSRLSDNIHKSVMAKYPNFAGEVRAVGRRSFREVYGNAEARNAREAYIAVRSGIEKSRMVIEALEMVKSEARSERIRQLFAHEVQRAVEEIARIAKENEQRKQEEERNKAAASSEKRDTNSVTEEESSTRDITKKKLPSNLKASELHRIEDKAKLKGRHTKPLDKNDELKHKTSRNSTSEAEDSRLVTDFVEEIIYSVLTDVCQSGETVEKDALNPSVLLADLLADLGVKQTGTKQAKSNPSGPKKSSANENKISKLPPSTPSFKTPPESGTKDPPYDKPRDQAYSVEQISKTRESKSAASRDIENSKEMTPPLNVHSEKKRKSSTEDKDEVNLKESKDTKEDLVRSQANANDVNQPSKERGKTLEDDPSHANSHEDAVKEKDPGKAGEFSNSTLKMTTSLRKDGDKRPEIVPQKISKVDDKSNADDVESKKTSVHQGASEDGVEQRGELDGEILTETSPSKARGRPPKLGRGRRKRRPSIHLRKFEKEVELEKPTKRGRPGRPRKPKDDAEDSPDDISTRKRKRKVGDKKASATNRPHKRVRGHDGRQDLPDSTTEDESDVEAWDKESLLQMKKCVTRLKQLRNAWPFQEPVDPVELEIPDYFDVIKKPMDLGTISKRLESVESKSSYYKTVDEVIADVKLVWENCMKYNKPKDLVYECAVSMQSSFDKMLKRLEKAEKLTRGSEPRRATSKSSLDVKGHDAVGGMCLAFGEIDDTSNSGWHKGKVLAYKADEHSYQIEWEESGAVEWHRFPSKKLTQLRLVAKK